MPLSPATDRADPWPRSDRRWLPAPGRTSGPASTPTLWTTVSVGRRGSRLVSDLRRGALSPYLTHQDDRGLRVALVSNRALLLGGDHVGIRVHVGAGAVLELVETSGTVAYDGRGRPARWTVEVVVDSGGALVWDALPFVVSTGADVSRAMSVSLGDHASALVRETLVLGRSGECGGRLRTQLAVDGPHGPILLEDLQLDGARPEPGILGEHRVVDSITSVGRRPTWRPRAGVGPAATVLDLEEPGAVARSLGEHAHRVVLDDVFHAWRGEVITL